MLEAAARIFDPSALALVVGGSLAVAALRSTGSDIGRSLAALRPLFAARPQAEERIAKRALRQVEAVVEVKGIACADRAHGESAFVRQAALKLMDAPSADAFAEWGSEELSARAERHRAVAGFWRSAADAAPSMGMVGTVLGLIGMFAVMDDAARMGPAMALAMLTTFYGLMLGTVVFGPIADRLERLSAAEILWQSAILRSLDRLARAEPQSTEAWLKRRSKARS